MSRTFALEAVRCRTGPPPIHSELTGSQLATITGDNDAGYTGTLAVGV